MVHPLQSSISPDLALIFDMDGVIVDSNRLHSETWTAFNSLYGLETSEQMLLDMFGKRNDDIVRNFFGEGLSAEEIIARGAAKEQLFREMAKGRVEEMLTSGLRGFLERHRGTRMALASNAEPENIAFILAEAGLEPYFRAVLDGHLVQRPKPFPDLYLLAAERLNVSPANCIVFEDSYSGVEAGRAAGMRVVGVRSTHQDLPGCDFTIDDFLSEDLEAWLSTQSRI